MFRNASFCRADSEGHQVVGFRMWIRRMPLGRGSRVRIDPGMIVTLTSGIVHRLDGDIDHATRRFSLHRVALLASIESLADG